MKRRFKMGKIIAFLKENYGSDDNPDKSIIWVALGFLCWAFVILALFVFNIEKHSTLMYILSIYFIVLFFELPISMIAFYIFRKKNNSKKYKKLKYIFVIGITVLLVISLMPYAIILFLLEKAKLINLYKYSLLYFAAFIIALLVSLVVGIILYILIYPIKVINHQSIIVTFVFILTNLLMKLVGKAYFEYKIWRYKSRAKKDKNTHKNYQLLIEEISNDGKQYQKELYLLIYIIIAVGGIFLYFFNFKDVENWRESFIYCFALYTAFDLLIEKWRKI